MQSFCNFVQYGVDDLLNVTLVQVPILRRNALYQFGPYHCPSAGAGWQIAASIRRANAGDAQIVPHHCPAFFLH
jgi:hypothetical protein